MTSQASKNATGELPDALATIFRGAHRAKSCHMAATVALPSTPSFSRMPSLSTSITPNPTRNAASADFLERLQQAEQRDTDKATLRKQHDRVQLGKELRAHKIDRLLQAQSEQKKKYTQTMSAAAERKEAALNADFEARKQRNAEKQKRAERIREERLKQVKDRQAAWRRAQQQGSPLPSQVRARAPLRTCRRRRAGGCPTRPWR